MNMWYRYNDLKLPPLEAFYSGLYDSHCSCYVLEVFIAFGLKSFGEYSDLHLKCDVLQLADFFETFRDNALKNYVLGPVHYVTIPSYT